MKAQTAGSCCHLAAALTGRLLCEVNESYKGIFTSLCKICSLSTLSPPFLFLSPPLLELAWGP